MSTTVVEESDLIVTRFAGPSDRPDAHGSRTRWQVDFKNDTTNGRWEHITLTNDQWTHLHAAMCSY